MRLVVLLLYAALLGGGWQRASADEDTLRALEIDEFHRTLSAETIAGLDGSPAVAARAALAIGRTKRAEGIAPLRAHLGALDVSVRAMVVYALGLETDETSLADLQRLARSDENSAVRYAAVDALGRIVAAHADAATPGVAGDLLRVAGYDADPIVRGHAAAQLDAFKTAPGAPAIAAALERIETHDGSAGVRWHAAWMLFRGYAKFADLAFLTRETRDRDELIRIETVRALARRKELQALAIVRPLLADPSWRVQLEAREALRRLMLEPPTQHLKAFPPGLHLPPAAVAEEAAVTPVPAASPGPSAPPAAPDPTAFALGGPLLPTSAAGMNGPLPGLHPRVLLHTTAGDVVLRLYPEWAPSTVANFTNLVRAGYFELELAASRAVSSGK